MATRDQIALMTDTVNLQARLLAPVMVAALEGDPASADLAAILAAWDGRDDKDAAAPLIYHALYEEKVEAVVSGGVVDRQFHPHQKDQVAAWAQGRLLPWWLDPAKAESHARHVQMLRPQP